jgi:DNA-binding LacI/PurR family transcriptional regulator
MRIKDIAEIANVSKAAVSLALAGKPGISEGTRERILKIARETGYVSKHMIHSKNEPDIKSLQLIACANPVFLQDPMEKVPFFNELIYYIENVSRTLGCRLLFTTVTSDEFLESFKRLQNERAAAAGTIIIGSYLTYEQLLEFSKLQPKAVVLDAYHPTIPLNFVSVNNRIGGYQAGDYLIKMGHKRIGIVLSKPRNHNFDDRREGFYEALQSQAYTVEKPNTFWVMPGEANSQADFKKQIREHTGPLPTALFCENDYIAISVMKSFHELGIKVPEDISIIGYDDLREATVVTPELTTIRVEKKNIAEASVRLIQQIIANNQPETSKILVDTTVVERQSCNAVH